MYGAYGTGSPAPLPTNNETVREEPVILTMLNWYEYDPEETTTGDAVVGTEPCDLTHSGVFVAVAVGVGGWVLVAVAFQVGVGVRVIKAWASCVAWALAIAI